MRSIAVVLGTARTPFGRLGGALATLSAPTLAAVAMRAALERSGVDATDVEHVVLGQVLQAGVGQAPVRQALLKAGLAKTTTGETVNKVCASGLLAAVCAARLISDGDASVVLAGGMESMSNAPYLLPGVRKGYRLGHGVMQDAILQDGLTDAYLQLSMVGMGAKVAAEFGLSRAEQDAFALASHERAAEAARSGRLAAEIVPLHIVEKQLDRLWLPVLPQIAVSQPLSAHQAPSEMQVPYARYMPFETGDVPTRLIEYDEAVRADASLAALAKLSALDIGGTVTAGNAPGLSDGAAALVLAHPDWAREHELTPLAELIDHATVAWDPPYLPLTPAFAAQRLLARHGLQASDIAVWEINEAFAAVALIAARELGIAPDVMNRHGGAIACGHPLGASGARILASVVHQLRARGGGWGIAAICSGGGQGDAVLVRVRH